MVRNKHLIFFFPKVYMELLVYIAQSFQENLHLLTFANNCKSKSACIFFKFEIKLCKLKLSKLIAYI